MKDVYNSNPAFFDSVNELTRATQSLCEIYEGKVTRIEKYGAEKMQDVYDLLRDKNLLEEYTATKEGILETYDILKPYFRTDIN